MRERVTFVHGSQEAFDPSQLRIEKDGLHIASLKAAREDRLTFGFQELPQEVNLPEAYYVRMIHYSIAMESVEAMS